MIPFWQLEGVAVKVWKRQVISRPQETRLQNKRIGARLIAVGYRNVCDGTCSFSPHAFPYELIHAQIACSHRYVPYPTE
jgi:hypothetical protein